MVRRCPYDGRSRRFVGLRQCGCCGARQRPSGCHHLGLNLAHTDDSEARCRRSRRFSLRVRSRPPTTSTKPSSGNSRPWRPLKPPIVQPVVGWTNGLGRQAVKEHVACRLEARHRTEREAHVLRLAELHQQRMLLAMSDETGERTDEVSGSPGMGQGGSKLPRLLPPVWMISPADHGRAGRTSDKGHDPCWRALHGVSSGCCRPVYEPCRCAPSLDSVTGRGRRWTTPVCSRSA